MSNDSALHAKRTLSARNLELQESASQGAADERVDVLGVGISAVSMESTLETIGAWIDHGESKYVCVSNVHTVMECQSDPELMAIHNDSGLTVADGAPIHWAAKSVGPDTFGRVRGPDLLPEACELAAARGWRVYFYGGDPGTPERLARNLTARFPALRVVGTYSPPFRPLTEREEAEIVASINQVRPDLVWVGLSAPKQERWMGRHVDRLGPGVLIGVGAAFDIHAGLKPQAPRWMRPLGLEWVFRLLLEPRRLWRRYLSTNPRFLIEVIRRPPRRRKPTRNSSGGP